MCSMYGDAEGTALNTGGLIHVAMKPLKKLIDELDERVFVGPMIRFRRVVQNAMDRVSHYPKHTYNYFRHGFCPCETWSLYANIAKYTVPRLKYLRDNKIGVPSEFGPTHGRVLSPSPAQKAADDKAWKEGEAKWDAVLNEILFALEWCVDEDWEREGIVLNKDDQLPADPAKMQAWLTNTHKNYDWAKLKVVEERVQKGLDLFAKYFRNLWD